MTFVEVAFLLPGVTAGAVWVLLLAYVRRNAKHDQITAVAGLDHLDDEGLDHLDELRWNSWSHVVGWPTVLCWQGCANLHSDQWWRAYLTSTCWDGCTALHREDWWRAYVDQAEVDQAEVSQADVRRELILAARTFDLGRTPQWPSSDDQVRAPLTVSPVLARLSG